jgi:hypothetical protein
MVTLQPRLPGRGREEGARRKETGKRKREWKMIYGAAAVIVVAVILAVVVMVYSAPPPSKGSALSDSQVRQELQRVKEISAYPGNLNIRPADYPKTFGVWNNRTLVEQYFCSDVCPDYGRVNLVFQGADNEECARIGGNSLHDIAFGGYIGCQPRAE